MQFFALKDHQHHAYDKNGKRLFITRLLAQRLVVTQIKTQEKDGYQAVQIGLGSAKRINKPIAGHLKKAEIKTRTIREIRLADGVEKAVKDTIPVGEILAIGDLISVHAVSKGAGFAGVVKRYHFKGGPKTHGQSDRHRGPGSIGQGTTPGRVFKGKHMAGHMGSEMVAVKGGKVVFIDEAKHELWITGSVPGKPGAVVAIKKVKSGTFVGLKNVVEREVKVEAEVKTEE